MEKELDIKELESLFINDELELKDIEFETSDDSVCPGDIACGANFTYC